MARIFAIVGFIACAAAAAATQDVTRIIAGESTGGPGADAVLPISLAAPDDVRVGAIAIRLGFSKAFLEFGGIEPGGNVDAVGARVKAEVKAGPDDTTAVLHVSVTATSAAGKRHSVPSGPLAYITFKIAKDAKAGSSIVLTHEADVSTTDEPARPVTPVVASKAEIQITAPALTACFFYMH